MRINRLILLLLLKAIVLGLLILFYNVGLSPDEAQYWTWSQQLDWGYYSKPPGIAWQIWGSTALLGNSEFGVRAGALLIGFLIPLAVYYLARVSGLNEKTAFWAGVVTAFSPFGVYLSLAATTDGGAIFFLILGIAVVAKGLQEESGPNYPLAGVWIFFGALYKWIAFALWPFVFFYIIFYPKMRKASLFWGIVISLAALIPPLYWNASHEWATFKHVGGALGTAPSGNFFDFLGAQIGLVSPVYLGLLILAFIFLFRKREPALYFCAGFPLAVLIYLFSAFFKKIQPNWAAYLYPPGMVLIAWAGYPRYRIWLHIGTWVSICIIVVAFFMPWVSFRQSVGWNQVPRALEKAGYDPNTDFLMGDKYQAASILSFYSPGQKRAYFFNISGTRKNQFSFWPQMLESEKGKTGYFVVFEKTKKEALPWYEQHYLKRLAPYFKSVTFIEAYPLYYVNGEPVKYALIFRGEDYLGLSPENPDVY